jgi:hypothetical protein
VSHEVLCLRPQADFQRDGVTRQSSATLFREAWANVERVLVKGEAPFNRVY